MSEEVVCWAGDKELPDAFLTDSSEWKVGTLGDPELLDLLGNTVHADVVSAEELSESEEDEPSKRQPRMMKTNLLPSRWHEAQAYNMKLHWKKTPRLLRHRTRRTFHRGVWDSSGGLWLTACSEHWKVRQSVKATSD